MVIDYRGQKKQLSLVSIETEEAQEKLLEFWLCSISWTGGGGGCSLYKNSLNCMLKVCILYVFYASKKKFILKSEGVPQKWKQPKCLWNIFSHGKKWSTDAGYNMKEPGKHYARWKTITKDCTRIIRFHSNEVSRIDTSTQTENRLVVACG